MITCSDVLFLERVAHLFEMVLHWGPTEQHPASAGQAVKGLGRARVVVFQPVCLPWSIRATTVDKEQSTGTSSQMSRSQDQGAAKRSACSRNVSYDTMSTLK